MFEWDRPATIVIQPSERKSGVDVSMDGSRSGARPNTQQSSGFNIGSGNNNNGLGNNNGFGGNNNGLGNNNRGNNAGNALGSIVNNLFN